MNFKINQGKYVPLPLRFAITLGLFFVEMKVLTLLPELIGIVVAILISFLLPALWFSYDILVINTNEKTIFSGVWLMGLKIGNTKKFNLIEKIFVNKVKTRQTMYAYHSYNKHTARGIEYHAYLKLDNDGKIFLMGRKNKEDLHEKLKKIKDKLGLSLEI